MALRRRRTRNPKYFSEEFESVFSKKNLLSEGYMEVVLEGGASYEEGEQTVMIDGYDGQTVQYTQVWLILLFIAVLYEMIAKSANQIVD
jgi:hypothetical protein